MGWSVRPGHLVLIEPSGLDADACLTGLVETMPDDHTVVVDLGSSPRLNELPCTVAVSLYTPEAFSRAERAGVGHRRRRPGRAPRDGRDRSDPPARDTTRREPSGRRRGLQRRWLVRCHYRRDRRPVRGWVPGARPDQLPDDTRRRSSCPSRTRSRSSRSRRSRRSRSAGRVGSTAWRSCTSPKRIPSASSTWPERARPAPAVQARRGWAARNSQIRKVASYASLGASSAALIRRPPGHEWPAPAIVTSSTAVPSTQSRHRSVVTSPATSTVVVPVHPATPANLATHRAPAGTTADRAARTSSGARRERHVAVGEPVDVQERDRVRQRAAVEHERRRDRRDRGDTVARLTREPVRHHPAVRDTGHEDAARVGAVALLHGV